MELIIKGTDEEIEKMLQVIAINSEQTPEKRTSKGHWEIISDSKGHWKRVWIAK